MKRTTPIIPHDIDSLLRSRLRKATPDPAPHPWFTRRVLQRLPAHQRPLLSRTELCAIAAITASGIWLGVHELRLLMQAPDPSAFDFTLLIVGAVMCLTAMAYIMVPVLRRA